jgi:hypothetical protein
LTTPTTSTQVPSTTPTKTQTKPKYRIVFRPRIVDSALGTPNVSYDYVPQIRKWWGWKDLCGACYLKQAQEVIEALIARDREPVTMNFDENGVKL